MREICFVSLLLLASGNVRLEAANHLHVSPGQGHIHNSVYDTIQEALNNVQSGTQTHPSTITIYKGPIMKDGTLSHVLRDSVNGLTGSEVNSLVVPAALQWVIIKGHTYLDHVVTINGNGTGVPSNYGFLQNGRDVTVENLKFTNCRWGAVRVGGIGSKVKNCVFDANHRQGLRVTGTNATIESCTFKNTKEMFPKSAAVGCGVYQSGCKVKDCYAYDNDQDGFRLWHADANNSGDNCVVENCFSYNNGYQGLLALNVKNIQIVGGEFYI